MECKTNDFVQNMANIVVGYQEAHPAIVKQHKASLARPCSQDCPPGAVKVDVEIMREEVASKHEVVDWLSCAGSVDFCQRQP